MRNVSPLLRFSFIWAVVCGTAAYVWLESDPWRKKARVETLERMAQLQSVPNTVAGWPPTKGMPFPQVTLLDSNGEEFSVTRWRGKPTLVEIATMTCAACQAFSGGHKRGGFRDFPPQDELKSIEEYFWAYAGSDLFSDEVNFAQILIYNDKLEPAGPEDAVAWRSYFGFDKTPHVKILAGGPALANSASFHLIPGFFLLDENGVVVMDSTGHNPRDHLLNDLLPTARDLICRRRREAEQVRSGRKSARC